MPTPKAGYFLRDGSRVPGTTTVIGRWKESGALIHWAWECGKNGQDYRQLRDSAASAGTLAHAFVESHINGVKDKEIFAPAKLQSPALFDKAVAAYEMYRKWERQSKLKIVAQEILLVSEVHRFGGTPDAIGKIGKELCLVDWKTSNGLYRDMLIQVAAYKALWEENNPDQLLTGGFHICRFSKNDADFAHHYYQNLDEAWEQFLLFRRAYEIDKMLKKRAA